jgi:hypothetical protein
MDKQNFACWFSTMDVKWCEDGMRASLERLLDRFGIEPV